MAVAIQPFDFWNLFVIQVFGGFWPAVLGLAAIFFLIMMILGRMSMYSCIFFMLMFFVCMAMGYGYGLVTIPITLFILSRFMYDIILLVGGRK